MTETQSSSILQDWLSCIHGLLFQCKPNSENRTDSEADETFKCSKLRFDFHVKREKVNTQNWNQL